MLGMHVTCRSILCDHSCMHGPWHSANPSDTAHSTEMNTCMHTGYIGEPTCAEAPHSSTPDTRAPTSHPAHECSSGGCACEGPPLSTDQPPKRQRASRMPRIAISDTSHAMRSGGCACNTGSQARPVAHVTGLWWDRPPCCVVDLCMHAVTEVSLERTEIME